MKKILFNFLLFSLIVTTLIPSPSFATSYTNPDGYKGDEYGQFKSVFRMGPTIPGTSSDDLKWVPQGLTYSSTYNMLFTSHYWKNGKDETDVRPSTIAKLSLDGTFGGNVLLKNPDGTDHIGHVGGITIANGDMWIASTIEENGASEPRLYRVDLEKIVTASDGDTITLDKEYGVPTSSTITSRNGELWLASYYDGDNNCISDEQTEFGRVYRYSINASGDPVLTNDYPIPDEVQGLAITDNFFVFSRSCGRTNESYLSTYWKQADGGPDVTHFRDSMKMLPMSQGIVEVGNKMYVNFESWSPVYRLGEDGNGMGSDPTKYIHYAETGHIIPDYTTSLYGAEKTDTISPYTGKIHTWAESVPNIYDIRVEIENFKYKQAAVNYLNVDDGNYASISFRGENTLDNDTWNRTYTNLPDPEFDNFEDDTDANDDDNVVRVTAQGDLVAEKSYYFGTSFERTDTSFSSGQFEVWANLSRWDSVDNVYRAEVNDRIGLINWQYGIDK